MKISVYKKLVIVLCLTISGCASIISGANQKIAVSSNPEGAIVTAQPGDYRVTTPATLTLPRIKGPFILTFTKEGYSTMEIRLDRKTNGWIWGNLFIGGIIGIAIDFSTGSSYELSPETVHSNLTKLPFTQVPNEPSSLLIFDKTGTLLLTLTSKN
jgi:hypothetical protein